MRSVAIIADDLTGALDSAAPFATASDPLRVAWQAESIEGDARFAYDTESRDLAAGEAEARVAARMSRLARSEVGFKKVDSLMRGNTLGELAACAASGVFHSVVIAPAFPEQGRITRSGAQVVPGPDGAPAIAADLAGDLARHDIPVHRVARGGALPDRGVALCDAETAEDLAGIAARGMALDGPVLWCGSGGLARALAAPVPSVAALRAGQRLFVVGSRHPVAVAQATRLRAQLGDDAALVTGREPPQTSVAPAVRALAEGRSGAVLFALPPLAPDRAAGIMAATFAALARTQPPAVLVAVGGDTLYRLCRAIGAECLLATGEWSPGVALAEIIGGPWHGVQMVTKAGAFADRDVLARLLESPVKEPCA